MAVKREPGIMLYEVRVFAELVKPRMVFLLSYVGLASGLAAYSMGPIAAPVSDPGIQRPFVNLVMATLAVAFGSMGANSITACVDADIDRLMVRTAKRPVPSGRVKPLSAIRWGIWLVAIAIILTVLTGVPWSTAWLVFGILDDVLIYSAWLKRRTPLNIIAGSPAGGAPAMVVASAVSGRPVDTPALLLASLVVVWTPVHLWSLALEYRDDYKRAGVPMLPVALSVRASTRCIASASLLLAVSSVALAMAMGLRRAYLPVHAAATCLMIGLGFLVFLRPERRYARWLFKYSSPYLAIMCTLLIVR